MAEAVKKVWRHPARAAIVLSALLAMVVFLATLQTEINGSEDRYATDVGEIQNALPRWGTIHFTGYPQYTALGSIFVNGLRLVGISPATGASLFSAVWGAAAAGFLTALIVSFAVPPGSALLAALAFTLSTSMWIDGSIAELHTMTMAITFAALLFAVRLRRNGRASDLYWLVFICSQGITHQRAFAFMAPALVVLVLPQWRLALRKWLPVLALSLSGPVTYLYLPLVDWLGSEWVFSAPGTWQGFWALVLDTKAERIVSIPGNMEALRERWQAILGLLNADWPALLWITGLLGLFVAWRRRGWESRGEGSGASGIAVAPPTPGERAALILVWVTYLLLSLIIWEGYVSDALLAVKLPVIAMAAVGMAFIGAELSERFPGARVVAPVGLLALVVFLFLANRPEVRRITKDQSAAQTIAVVEQIDPGANGQPVTMMALWGNDFWQLTYAQAYMGRFPHLNLVDHNANFREILARGDRLYTLGRTFLTMPLPAWEGRLGEVQLDAVQPGIVEISLQEQRAVVDSQDDFVLGNGIAIEEAVLSWRDEETLALALTWVAQETVDEAYSVAVHLVSQDPPAAPEHVLTQADSAHPVGGWYPTTEWLAGEQVTDQYLLAVPEGAKPVAVRVAMYRQLDGGVFENSESLSLPLPSRDN